MLAIENFGSKMSFIAAFFFLSIYKIPLNLMLGMGNAGCFRKINCKTWDQRNFSQIQMNTNIELHILHFRMRIPKSLANRYKREIFKEFKCAKHMFLGATVCLVNHALSAISFSIFGKGSVPTKLLSQEGYFENWLHVC